MAQTTSLHNLLEVSDLIAMVEDLIDPEQIQRVSPAALAGIRITLRSSRERILQSHAELSTGVVASVRSTGQTKILTAEDEVRSSQQTVPTQDLKSALERFVDRQ